MTPRDRVINTIYHRASAPIPTLLSIPRDVERARREECDELRRRFASEVDFLDYRFSSLDGGEKAYVSDAWGCFWKKTPAGFAPETDSPLLNDCGELRRLEIPEFFAGEGIKTEISEFCDRNPRFVVLQPDIRPLSRLLAILGREETLSAIVQKSSAVCGFLKRLHEAYLAELRAWCETDVDAVCIGDDWAEESGPFIPAKVWEEIFLPMMWDYAELLHKNDKFAYFTSSGDIQAYLPAVIAAGVDVVRVRDSQMNTSRAVSGYGSQTAFHVVMDDFLNEKPASEAISERILAIRRSAG